jgi:hypothetical protein
MQVKNELRRQHKAITSDLKSRAQKAEKILGEIEACEARIATLTDELSAVLTFSGKPFAAKSPKAKVSRKKADRARAVARRKVG